VYNNNTFSTEDTLKSINKTYKTNIISNNQGELIAIKKAFPIYYNLNQNTILNTEPTDLNNTFSKLDTLINPKPPISNPPKPFTINLFTGGNPTK